MEVIIIFVLVLNIVLISSYIVEYNSKSIRCPRCNSVMNYRFFKRDFICKYCGKVLKRSRK